VSVKFTSVPTKILADSITSSATAFRLNNITGWDGDDLVAGDFGSTAYGVFRNATNTTIEFFEFDPATIASATITITRRGLAFDAADLTTEVSANKRSWNRGDTFVDLGTDTPQMLQWLKEYIDTASIAGAVPATDAVQGIALLSTAAATPSAPVVVGDNDPRVPTADENNAMAGGDDLGTPSTSNKFMTQTGLQPAVEALYSAITFPVVEATRSAAAANSTAVSVQSPTGTQAGDLLVLFLNKDTLSGITGGYTVIDNTTNTGLQIYAKIATGSDTFAGTGTSGTTGWAAVVYRISNYWQGLVVTDIVKGIVTTDALNPENRFYPYLWLAAYSNTNTGNATAAPTDYTGLVTATSNDGDSGETNMAVAQRNLRAIHENPGAFTTTGNQGSNLVGAVAIKAASTYLLS